MHTHISFLLYLFLSQLVCFFLKFKIFNKNVLQANQKSKSRYFSQNFINKQIYLYNIKKNKKHQPKAKILKSIYFSKKNHINHKKHVTLAWKNQWLGQK